MIFAVIYPIAVCVSRAAGCLVVVVCILGSTGCDRGPKRIAISGSVTLDGRPVRDATIVFTPEGTGLAAAATIDEGQFTLTESDGPTVGGHAVRINPNEAELEEADPAELAKANRKPSIPKIYQQAGKLTAQVTGEPKQQLSFELTSKR